MWGFMWGQYGDVWGGETKALPGEQSNAGFLRPTCTRSSLDSACPFNGRPAIIDVKFAIDALGMGADGAQGDHEFIRRSPAQKAQC